MTKWKMGLSSIDHPYSLKNIMGRFSEEEYPDYPQKLAKAHEILQGFMMLEYEDQVQLVEGKLGMSVEEFRTQYKIYREVSLLDSDQINTILVKDYLSEIRTTELKLMHKELESFNMSIMEGSVLIPVVKLINTLGARSEISQEEFNLRIWEVKPHFIDHARYLKKLHSYRKLKNMIEVVYDGLSGIAPEILRNFFEDLNIDDDLISFERPPHR